MRCLSKVLMPCSRTLAPGTRSLAPTTAMLARPSCSMAAAPGMTAPTWAALFWASRLGTALSRVAASGPPRHRAPASALTAATPPWPAKRLTSAPTRAAPSRPQLSFWARPSLARREKLWRKKPLTREVGRFKSRQGSGSPRPWASRAVSSASARGTDAVWSLPALAMRKLRATTPCITKRPKASRVSSSAAGAAKRVSLSASNLSAPTSCTTSCTSAAAAARAGMVSALGRPQMPGTPLANTRQFTPQAASRAIRCTAR